MPATTSAEGPPFQVQSLNSRSESRKITCKVTRLGQTKTLRQARPMRVFYPTLIVIHSIFTKIPFGRNYFSCRSELQLMRMSWCGHNYHLVIVINNPIIHHTWQLSTPTICQTTINQQIKRSKDQQITSPHYWGYAAMLYHALWKKCELSLAIGWFHRIFFLALIQIKANYRHENPP